MSTEVHGAAIVHEGAELGERVVSLTVVSFELLILDDLAPKLRRLVAFIGMTGRASEEEERPVPQFAIRLLLVAFPQLGRRRLVLPLLTHRLTDAPDGRLSSQVRTSQSAISPASNTDET